MVVHKTPSDSATAVADTAAAVLNLALALMLLLFDPDSLGGGIAENLCGSAECKADLAASYGLDNEAAALAVLANNISNRVDTLGWALLLNFFYKLLNAALSFADWTCENYFAAERLLYRRATPAGKRGHRGHGQRGQC